MEFSCLKEILPFDFNVENIIDDWVSRSEMNLKRVSRAILTEFLCRYSWAFSSAMISFLTYRACISTPER